MNSKVKGVLQVLLVLVLIAAFAFVAARGIGGAHRGSAKNIRLGLDLEGGVSVTYQAYKTDSTGKRTGEQPTDKDMADTIYKMQKRVETLESTKLQYIRKVVTVSQSIFRVPVIQKRF